MTARVVRLGDLCEINPRLPRDHDLEDDSDVSFVPMAAVSEVSGTIESATIRHYAEVKKGYTSFSDGDVLFAKITPCMENGKAALARGLVGGRGFGSTEFHVLRARESVLPEWIYYFVRREPFRREAKRNFTGTAGQQRVPASFLQDSLVHVPPLEEQRRIVDLLARAEGILRLRREAQQKAAELIPAIFIDMFGDPATNPKQWPVRNLGEVLDAVDYGNSTKASATGAGLPIIRMGNVTTAGEFDLDDLKFVELSDYDAERFRLRKGDLLFNRTNSKELVGKTGLWEGSLDAVAASYFIRLRTRLEAALPSYLWAWINSRHMKRVLFDTARGAIGQANINSKELRAFPVAVPPMKLQQAFEFRVPDIRAMCRQQRAAASVAATTAQSLLARAFGGCG